MSQRSKTDQDKSAGNGKEKVRLDKWLWAARFYKTRSVARDAIEGGKVHVNGQRAKPSKEARVGDMIVLRQGFDEKTVSIQALSDVRRGAPEAQLLYQETDASIKKREDEAAQRKALRGSHPFSDRRPDKKQRRDIERLREKDFGD
ncbi:ribosome-associated heat shock protein Hsp15 [Sansalvadorimonas sp. 2012CJ34-2]|uniref:Heat shock protein 15 n=1 Tax=Parendozoicomonas callyspongiae TaxID=2942213 RepID=A0ABT0PIK8_9GAMM|nr:ribosome-associated heat shock protein Hsp15 [Sansalvadorimonas sp. 2012CJ34-2]MCL6271163.1 ribosome-associated heat shock protein Hsp15 [Sansalvadorimonas sp. 2012CJ34-2]